MQIDGAVIKEQGITFSIVIVKSHILNNNSTSDEARRSFQPLFPGIPLILMAQDSRGVPTYQGRTDIVKFLSKYRP